MRKRKTIAIVVAVCVLALACVGGALAWLSATGVLVNTFGIGTVAPAVEETLQDAVKSNVYVTNEGTAPMYLRAEVDIYWQDENGNRLWEQPVEGTNYQITWGDQVKHDSDANAENTWTKGRDGHWYWTSSVAPGKNTGVLISNVREIDAQAGRNLVVDVMTQAVQASPEEAACSAWGCSFKSGVLVPPAASTEGE